MNEPAAASAAATGRLGAGPDADGCHWVGMAGYYGVPWAYNTFLDDDCGDP